MHRLMIIFIWNHRTIWNKTHTHTASLRFIFIVNHIFYLNEWATTTATTTSSFSRTFIFCFVSLFSCRCCWLALHCCAVCSIVSRHHRNNAIISNEMQNNMWAASTKLHFIQFRCVFFAFHFVHIVIVVVVVIVCNGATFSYWLSLLCSK